MSHLDVQDIAQDALGNMWFATLSGLNRYNGYEFEHFLCNPADSTSLTHDFVFSLLPGDGSYLWVGTAMGLQRYDLQQERFELFHGPTAPVYRIFRDAAGNIWTATPIGAGKVRMAEKTVDYNDGMEAVNVLWEDSYHRIWAGLEGGLGRIDSPKERFYLPGRRTVLSQYTDPNGRWWLGTDQGIFLFDPVSGTVVEGPDFLPPTARDRINFIRETEPSKLLIGTTTDGLFQYDLITKVLLHNQPVRFNPGRSAELNACYIDRQGYIWIGTYDKGFVFCNKQADLFNTDNVLARGLADKFVTRVTGDRHGNLWIATRYDGLYRYSPAGRLDRIDLSGILPGRSEFFEVCYVDDKDRLWLAFETLLAETVVRADKAVILRSFNIDHVRCLEKGPDGNVWAGSYEGLFRISGGHSQPERIEGDEPIRNVSTILAVEDGILFSPYGSGVRHLDTRTLEIKPLEVSPEAEDVNLSCLTLARDSRGRIWMGSYGNGVACITPSRSLHLTTENGLPNINVLSIQEDFSGDIWVSTLQGIARIRLPEDSSPLRISIFPGYQFHEKSGCRTADGRIFFGGNHGLTFFDPARFPQSPPVPLIHLEDLRIWGQSVRPAPEGSVLRKSIAYTEGITLSHRQNALSLDWAGIDYYTSNNLTYKYRLGGFDRGWNDVGTFRRASWSNLPAGDYTFEVIAVADEGVESAPARLHIVVRPAPWLTWWAILAYTLLALAGAFLALRSLINARLEKQRAELEREARERDPSFLEKLSSLMEANLANPDLDIDFLAREMGYSRTSFYLRIKNATGSAPNEFVREYRLKRAAEAVKKGSATLSEIAEQTGFGSYSYFSKAFKKHFGLSPKAWQSRNQ